MFFFLKTTIEGLSFSITKIAYTLISLKEQTKPQGTLDFILERLKKLS